MGLGNSLCFPAPLSDRASSFPLSGSVELNQSHCSGLLSLLRALSAELEAFFFSPF